MLNRNNHSLPHTNAVFVSGLQAAQQHAVGSSGEPHGGTPLDLNVLPNCLPGATGHVCLSTPVAATIP